MKKIISLLLGAVIFAGVFSGCLSSDSNTEAENDSQSFSIASADSTESENDSSSSATSIDNAKEGGSNVLIVYYSLSGTTENVAKMIEEKIGGDIYLLEPEPSYPQEQQAVGTEVTAERESGSIRELKGALPDLSNYDYILIGGPVWSGEPSNPVQKYLSQTDFGDKKVSGFWSAYSDPANYADKFKVQVKNGNVLEGLSLINSDVSDNTRLNSKIDTWLNALGIS